MHAASAVLPRAQPDPAAALPAGNGSGHGVRSTVERRFAASADRATDSHSFSPSIRVLSPRSQSAVQEPEGSRIGSIGEVSFEHPSQDGFRGETDSKSVAQERSFRSSGKRHVRGRRRDRAAPPRIHESCAEHEMGQNRLAPRPGS